MKGEVIVQSLFRVLLTPLLLMAMSSSSSHAFAQTQPFLPDEPPKRPVEKAKKIDFPYLLSEAYLAGGTALDMKSTADVLGHPTTAYRADRTFLTHYYAGECGWAGVVFGKRNTVGAVWSNTLLNVGFDMLDRKLYRRGGRWRIAALGLNVLKGTGNWVDGFHNVRVDKNVDKYVRLETGYKTGLIIWSR